VTRVGDFDRGRDERAQRRVDVEGGEEAFAGVRSVLSNTSGRMSGSNRRRHSAISSSLPVKCWYSVRLDTPATAKAGLCRWS